jgi:hypothetical protein
MLIPDAPGANNATAQNTQAVLQDALMQEHAIHTAGKDSVVQNATTHRADALQTDGMTQETTDAMLTTGTGKKSRYTGIIIALLDAPAHTQQAQHSG